jgi:membrane-bound metal-dependent hydrolase YbcI (DUF457 family)
MPSPVGHALAGLTIHLLTARDRASARDGVRALCVVGAAVAPDLDLVLRFVDGQNHHQGASHSLGAALLAGVVVSLVTMAWRGRVHSGRAKDAWILGLLAASGWTSHVFLDYLGRDTHPPIGLLALWPVSASYYKFPWPLFFDVGRTLEWTTVVHNVVAVAWELVLLLPIPALLLWRRLRPT